MNNHRYKPGRKLTLDELEMLSGKSLVAYGTVQQLFPKGNTVYFFFGGGGLQLAHFAKE